MLLFLAADPGRSYTAKAVSGVGMILFNGIFTPYELFFVLRFFAHGCGVMLVSYGLCSDMLLTSHVLRCCCSGSCSGIVLI